MMKPKYRFIPLAVGLGLALVWGLGGRGGAATAAAGGERRIEAPSAPAAELHVCSGGCAYSSIQDAVDAADDGDVIKVAAGTYIDVERRAAPPGYAGSSVITQAVYISKTVTIRGGYATDNWAISDPENNPTTLDAGGEGRGVCIAAPAPGVSISPTVEGLRITGGDAGGLGGDPWDRDVGGGVYVLAASAIIDNNQVFSNSIAGWSGGGGLFLYESSGTVSDNEISHNAAAEGGGLLLVTSDATVSGNQIANNSAERGGGLFLSGSDATVSGNNIANNTANHHGGGLFLSGSDATVGDNIVSGNSAAYGGGGLYVGWSDALFRDNTVINNTADEGGGLFLSGGDATVSGNTVSNNSAAVGGGLFLEEGTATLDENMITYNAADDHGGGLFLWYSGARLSDNVVSFNATVNDDGGGLYLRYSPARLSGNTIRGNSAHWGGGLFVYASDATLNGNTISENIARSRGGSGLHLYKSDATLTNNIVAGNQTQLEGGGLTIWGGSPRLLHTTIARNSAVGGGSSGIHISEGSDWGLVHGTVALTNTVVASHSVGISVTGGHTVTVNGVLWHDVPITISRSVTGHVRVENEHTGDPGFVDPDNGDYHIVPGSAAMDAGVDAGVDHDIDGEPRPFGAGYDIGADEYYLSLEVAKQATPDPVAPGGQLTYRIRVTNTSDVNLHATVTDTLPLSVTLDEASGGTLALPGGTVLLPDGRVGVIWTAVITKPGGTWEGTLLATVDEDATGSLTNLVAVTTAEGAMGEASVTVSTPRSIILYLPLVVRGFP